MMNKGLKNGLSTSAQDKMVEDWELEEIENSEIGCVDYAGNYYKPINGKLLKVEK